MGVARSCTLDSLIPSWDAHHPSLYGSIPSQLIAVFDQLNLEESKLLYCQTNIPLA